jgi:hypothetical protein
MRDKVFGEMESRSSFSLLANRPAFADVLFQVSTPRRFKVSQD